MHCHPEAFTLRENAISHIASSKHKKYEQITFNAIILANITSTNYCSSSLYARFGIPCVARMKAVLLSKCS